MIVWINKGPLPPGPLPGDGRPPQIQRAGMSVADGFLASRSLVNDIQREGDFDEFLRYVMIQGPYYFVDCASIELLFQ